jgi:hypothetical protein
MSYSNDPFAGGFVAPPPVRPRQQPVAQRPQPKPTPRPVEVPPPDALGIELDPFAAAPVQVPPPDALGINP